MSAPQLPNSRIRQIIRTLMIGSGLTLILVGGALWSATVFNNIRYLVGSGGVPHSPLGQFSPTENGGTIDYGTRPTDGYSGAHLFVPSSSAEDQVLTGSFWSQTVGWIDFDNVKFIKDNTTPGQNTWTLSGYAWSDSAGWFDFGGVTYNLSNTSFAGYAWNDGIGYIDMSDARIELTSLGAIGKVKILGNAGGNRILETIYDIDTKLPATTTKAINQVRKNVALLKRNVPNSKINTAKNTNGVFTHGAGIESVNTVVFFENTSSTPARLQYDNTDNTVNLKAMIENSLVTPDHIYSVIVIGGDIYIDDSVIPEADNKPRVFIALKNDAGVGGNIYIDGNITQIYASLIAEGSLYSGEFGADNTPLYYNDDADNLFKIPNRQLYVYGTIISNNTIGGYGINNTIGNTCPYNITPCTDDTALQYDFNHFRDFQPDAPDSVLLRAYQPPGASSPQSTYDDYSMIIEHDFRIIDTPPPGLANF